MKRPLSASEKTAIRLAVGRLTPSELKHLAVALIDSAERGGIPAHRAIVERRILLDYLFSAGQE